MLWRVKRQHKIATFMDGRAIWGAIKLKRSLKVEQAIPMTYILTSARVLTVMPIMLKAMKMSWKYVSLFGVTISCKQTACLNNT